METKRFVLFIVLSVGVLIAWGQLFPPPKAPKPPARKVSQKKREKAKPSLVTTRKRPKARAHATSRPTSMATSRATSRATTLAARRATSRRASTRVVQKPKKAAPKLPKVKEKKLYFENDLYKAGLSNRGGGMFSFVMKKFRDPEHKKKKVSLNLFAQDASDSVHTFVERFLDKRLVAHARVSYKHAEKVPSKAGVFRFKGKIPSKEGGFLEVEKTYTFSPKDYHFKVSFKLHNRTNHALNLRVALGLDDYKDPKSLKGGGWFQVPEVFQVLCMIGAESHPQRKDFQKLDKEKPFKGKASFAAIDRRYFMTTIIPTWSKRDGRGPCTFESKRTGRIKLEIKNKGAKLAAGAQHRFHYTAYAGPKYYNRLKQVDQNAALESSIDFGIFAFLCRPMLWLMQVFYNALGKIGLANWGLAIIILTLLVKLLMWPLTAKSYKSMKAMQKLKPKMDALKEKYGDDKESMQRETMNLYMKEGINPVSGCLPMMLQMPIWIALYNTLFYSVELYQATFIPGWIDDLSARDPVYVLPILLGVSMFMQQRLTPQATMDETQAKIMAYLMPVMFTSFMFFLPAGLTLYIFVNTVLGIAHQWHMYNTPDDDDEADKKPKKKGGLMAKLQDMMEQQQQLQQRNKR